jgi:hypothetical protein
VHQSLRLEDIPPGAYIFALCILDPAADLRSARFATKNYFKGGRHPIGFLGFRVGEFPGRLCTGFGCEDQRGFPFDWTLEIEYGLCECALQTSYRVMNTGSKEMLFSPGVQALEMETGHLLTDTVGATGKLEEEEGFERLAPGGLFSRSFTITFEG